MGGSAIEMCVGLLTALAVVYGLERWGRWLSGLYGAPRWPRYVGLLGGMAPLIGTAATVFMLVEAFGATEGVDPAEKPMRLASGIARALYATAIGMGLSAVAVVLLLALTWRYHWSPTPPKADSGAPYR